MFETLLATMKTTEATRKAALDALWHKGLQDMHRGPWMLCCGEWQPITKTPHTCWRCRRLYFEEFATHD